MNQNSNFQYSADQHDPARGDQWQVSLIALLVTLLLHAGVFILLPDDWLMQQRSVDSVEEEMVELTLEQSDLERLRYVEANPEVPENEPDHTENYSFRSQQAADDNPAISRENTPAVAGDEASQKIIQGSVDQQESVPLENGLFALSQESVESRDESTREAQASNFIPQFALSPAPDFIRQKPEIEEGPGSSPDISDSGQLIVEENTDTNEMIQLYRLESTDVENQDISDSGRNTTEAKPLPRKRLTLPPDLVHGPLMRSKGSASRRGMIAIGSTFSQFGEYEQQFYAAVQAGWYQEIDFFQPIDTSARVVVQFRIQADGTVDEVKVLRSTAGEIATWICQLAITKRSPFRPWTKEMVQVFGRERVMQVAFSYL